jgi:hypothetical protein
MNEVRKGMEWIKKLAILAPPGIFSFEELILQTFFFPRGKKKAVSLLFK